MVAPPVNILLRECYTAYTGPLSSQNEGFFELHTHLYHTQVPLEHCEYLNNIILNNISKAMEQYQIYKISMQ